MGNYVIIIYNKNTSTYGSPQPPSTCGSLRPTIIVQGVKQCRSSGTVASGFRVSWGCCKTSTYAEGRGGGGAACVHVHACVVADVDRGDRGARTVMVELEC